MKGIVFGSVCGRSAIITINDLVDLALVNMYLYHQDLMIMLFVG